MTNYEHFDVVIVGGGIAGMAVAVGLLTAVASAASTQESSTSSATSSSKLSICVLEKAHELKPVGAALGLFPNGLIALKAISPAVEKRVRGSCIESERMIIRDADDPEQKVLQDTTLKSGGDRPGQPSPQYLVWYLLHQYLAEELPGGVLRLKSVVESVDVNDGIDNNSTPIRVHTIDRVTKVKSTLTCRVLIGADGINSNIRTHLFGESVLRYHGKVMHRGVLPLGALNDGACPPAGTQVAYKGKEAGKLFAFRETAPNIVTFTAMARVDDEPQSSSSTSQQGDHAASTKERLRQLFHTYPDEVLHVIDKVEGTAVYENYIYDIDHVLQECVKGTCILIGDACHAMTPGLGQGANIALEDAANLSHILAPLLLAGKTKDSSGPVSYSSREEISKALGSFWKERRPRVVEVHDASSRRTAQVNQSTTQNMKTTGSLNFRETNEDFTSRLYGWEPLSLSSSRPPS